MQLLIQQVVLADLLTPVEIGNLPNYLGGALIALLSLALLIIKIVATNMKENSRIEREREALDIETTRELRIVMQGQIQELYERNHTYREEIENLTRELREVQPQLMEALALRERVNVLEQQLESLRVELERNQHTLTIKDGIIQNQEIEISTYKAVIENMQNTQDLLTEERNRLRRELADCLDDSDTKEIFTDGSI